MAYTATVPIEYTMTWFYGSTVYLTATITANITATVADDYSTVTCALSNYNTNFQEGTGEGGGFVNIGGLMWNTDDFYESETLSDPANDSFTAAWNQLFEAAPSLEESMIIGVAVRDSDGQRETRQGTSWNTWTFDTSRDELQSGLTLVKGFSRWYNQTVDPSTSVVMSYYDYEVTIGGEDSTIPLPYYPFAVYISDTWQSCNRSGGSLNRYDGSAWADLQNNSLSDDAADNTVFNYDGSAWNKSPLIGET